jgi:hypothetical protein
MIALAIGVIVLGLGMIGQALVLQRLANRLRRLSKKLKRLHDDTDAALRVHGEDIEEHRRGLLTASRLFNDQFRVNQQLHSMIAGEGGKVVKGPWRN